MKDDRNRGAMRLMEALSGVDEILLERCSRENRTYRRPLWRSTRALAAVLCLAVVGAASWGGYQLASMKLGSSNSSGGAAQLNGIELEQMAEEALLEDGLLENAEAEDTASEGMASVKDEEAAPADKEGGEEYKSEKSGESAGSAGYAENAQNPEVEEEEAAEETGDSYTDRDACPPLQSEKLSEAQSREKAVLGAYVPTVLPKGYVFEDAYCVPGNEEANLMVCWSRGMDSIRVYLEKPENPPETVDVARTEIYDVRLYEIPYGETVPKEYQEVFDNPVFVAEDLNLEIIRSRMKSYRDQGDTDTPRGNFSVLYPDGVLVRFSGRGTAEEIWEMFCSMGEIK